MTRGLAVTGVEKTKGTGVELFVGESQSISNEGVIIMGSKDQEERFKGQDYSITAYRKN